MFFNTILVCVKKHLEAVYRLGSVASQGGSKHGFSIHI